MDDEAMDRPDDEFLKRVLQWTYLHGMQANEPVVTQDLGVDRSLYLVANAEVEFHNRQAGDFAVVRASSADEARIKYGLSVGIEDVDFLEWCYGAAVNMGFLETFVLKRKEEKEAFMIDGEVLCPHDRMARRVREFFEGEAGFADIFMAHV